MAGARRRPRRAPIPRPPSLNPRTFSILGLPYPTADALGRTRFASSRADVDRAFRRASVGVHPDKHADSDMARAAFEAVKDAHACLSDGIRLVREAVGCLFMIGCAHGPPHAHSTLCPTSSSLQEETLRRFAHAAVTARDALDAAAPPDERAARAAAASAERKRLRQEEASARGWVGGRCGLAPRGGRPIACLRRSLGCVRVAPLTHAPVPPLPVSLSHLSSPLLPSPPFLCSSPYPTLLSPSPHPTPPLPFSLIPVSPTSCLRK